MASLHEIGSKKIWLETCLIEKNKIMKDNIHICVKKLDLVNFVVRKEQPKERLWSLW